MAPECVQSSGSSPILLVKTPKKYNLHPVKVVNEVAKRILADDRSESNDTLQDAWIREAKEKFPFLATRIENAQVQRIIGGYYYYGDGAVSKNDAKAFYWLMEAAKEGDCIAANLVASYYLKGEYPVQQSNSEALHWYEKAAEGGNAEALYILGSSYAYGSLKYRNLEKAKAYLELAANKGNEGARDLLFHLNQLP